MHRGIPTLPLLALGLTGVLALAGCATGQSDAVGSEDGRIAVVASTSVYGQIAEEVGGDAVEVTSIVSSTSQDPHSFEPSARDQLAVQRADLIIENGGGYDAFIDALIDASGSTAPVLTAAEFSHDWPGNEGHDDASPDPATDDEHDHGDHEHVEGFNEHVWYDAHAMDHLAEEIAHQLSELDPEQTDTFRANAATFSEGIAGVEASLAGISAAHAGEQVFVTEPVPLYLVAAAGLTDVTPDAFSEAVEEGQDVAPATLLDSLELLRSGDVRVVVVNSQTGGAETTEVIGEAESLSIPVLEFSETLPEGQTYLSWMQANIEALSGALAR